MTGRANVIININRYFSKADAIIEIYASETAVITVQKDGQIIKVIDFSKDAVSDDRSDDRVYLLPIKEDDYGDYILSSSLSANQKTVSVIGSDIYQVIAPESFYLFKHGDGAVVPLTTGHESNSSCSYNTDAITVNYTGSSNYQILCRNTNAIDLSKWSSINAVGTITARTTDSKYMGYVFAHTTTVTANGSHSGLAAKIAILTGTSEQTTSLDISAVTTATGYVGIVGGMKGTITAIYLER